MNKFIELNDRNFTKETKKGLILVDFYLTVCPHCQALEPISDKISQEYQEKLKIAKIEAGQNRETSIKFKIFSTPTLILFKDGQEVEKMVGFQSEEEIKEKLDKLI